MKRRVCMKRLRRLKCKCYETGHFVRNEMSRIVIFLSWKKVTNRDFFLSLGMALNRAHKNPQHKIPLLWKSIQHIYETPQILRSIFSTDSCLHSDNCVSTSNTVTPLGAASVNRWILQGRCCP